MTRPKIDLRQGDCLAEMALLPSESVDLVVADPPYNLGKDYGNNHDLRGFREYLAFTEAWLEEARRVLKPTGSIYVFMGVRFISYLYDILDQKLGFFQQLDNMALHAGHGKDQGVFPTA
jgi:site-specific DNA-methyltransferase (adenine-specific)